MSASPNVAASDPKTLFRNAHNVPLKCFLQHDAAKDQVKEVASLLENYGADVSGFLQHALVVLVDPPTPGGQLLIQELGGDPARAVLDFGWVKDCIKRGHCLGPAENWGGHRLPVTNVNDFFSFSGPSPVPRPPPPQTSHSSFTGSVGPYPLSPSVSAYQSPHSHVPTPTAVSLPAAVPVSIPAPAPHLAAAATLPSPAISHPLPPSPISTHQPEQRSDIKPEIPIGRPGPGNAGSSMTAPVAKREVSAKSSQSASIEPIPLAFEEPTPPDPCQMVQHHNGMGAKFTDADNEYIRNYFTWSLKHFPSRTRGQILEKIHERMPYHSVVSVTQFMRRHPEKFGEFNSRRGELASSAPPPPPKPAKVAASKARENHREIPYDPGNIDNDEPPKPPTNLIPFAKGYRFTSADDQFIIAYFNWHAKKFPGSTKSTVLRDLAVWAPFRSLPSWTTYLSKHVHEWRKLIPLLENEMSDDDMSSHGPEEEDSTFKQEGAGASNVGAAAATFAPEIDEADARRWNPPRRSSLNKSTLTAPVQTDDGDTSYDDRAEPPLSSALARKPRSPRASRVTQQMTVEQKQPRERRRSLAFSAEERQLFIEFLSEHPWVWTMAIAAPEWLVHATTASAVWAKYQSLHPHRSDASWREYHKRNAHEFDPEAKRLRLIKLGLLSADAPIAPVVPAPVVAPTLPPTEDLSDQESFEDEDLAEREGIPFNPTDDMQGSSFSYHPLPPAAESDDDEEDQLRTDEEDDEDMPSASNEPSTRATSPAYGSHGKRVSRKGRAYLPFSPEQKERFMEFLARNPQVWVYATPNQEWITWEQQHQGKDSTWKKLALIPGMENHSYKSWREYHRARAQKVDPEARRIRLRMEAGNNPSTAPSVSMASDEEGRKRSRSVASDMEIGTPGPEFKRAKLDEAAESMTMREETLA